MSNLQAHEQRVVDEQRQLLERLEKLREFFKGELFGGLPQTDRALLLAQEACMTTYARILESRIARFVP